MCRIQSKQNSLISIICLIHKVWEVSWDIWEDRNQVLHHEQNGLELLGLSALDDEIIEEQVRCIDALMIDNEKHLFETSIEVNLINSIIFHCVYLNYFPCPAT